MYEAGGGHTTATTATTTSESAAAAHTADDTTVPTDLTVSVSSDGGHHGGGGGGQTHRSPNHRARLMHDLQLLRVELAEVAHQRQVEQREQQSRVDELEDQLAEALHQRNMLQIRLTGQLGQYEAEAARLRQQLQQLVTRQQHLENENSRLQVTPDQVKRSLMNLTIGETRYQELSKLDLETMTLRDFAAVRLYEAVSPLEVRCKQLQEERDQLSAELDKARPQLATAHSELAEARQLAERARQEQLTSLQQLSDAHQKLRDSALPRAVKDDLQVRLGQAQAEREAALTRLSELLPRAERADEAERELKTATDRLSAAEADQLSWARRLAEAAARQTEAEEEAARLRVQAQQLTEAELEARRQYAALRDSARAQHQQQMAELRTQMLTEQASERAELRAAQEKLQQREVTAREEGKQTLERLESELAAERARLAEISARLQIAEYETERFDVAARETAETAQRLREENAGLSAKLKEKESALEQVTASGTKERTGLEHELTQLRQQLAAYQQFEKSWDRFIAQAAEGGEGAELLLRAAPPLPAGSQRRLQHSLQLGRRLVDSETEAGRLRTQLRQQTERAERLHHQVGRLEPLLRSPQTEDRWRAYESAIELLRTEKVQLSQRLQLLDKQLRATSEQRDKLLTDIEALLQQEDEISTIKLLLAPMVERDSSQSLEDTASEPASPEL